MAPITAQIEPDFGPALKGEMTTSVMDLNGMVSNILDSSLDNRIDVDWKIWGVMAVGGIPAGDTYTVKAYFEALELLGNDYEFDTLPAGPTLINTGVLAGTTRTFGTLHIPLAAGDVVAGLYGLTVVLTHQPAAGAPYIFGFVDCGKVQFF